MTDRSRLACWFWILVHEAVCAVALALLYGFDVINDTTFLVLAMLTPVVAVCGVIWCPWTNATLSETVSACKNQSPPMDYERESLILIVAAAGPAICTVYGPLIFGGWHQGLIAGVVLLFGWLMLCRWILKPVPPTGHTTELKTDLSC
jgi:hypothetical protein